MSVGNEEPNGYCGLEDLVIGELMLPEAINPIQYIDSAADEMDARIGLLYEVPVQFEVTDRVKFRATIQYLKSINARLASGRLLMAAASALELTTVHAYARNLVEDAQDDLKQIVDRKYILQGAKENTNTSDAYVASRVVSYNQDLSSAVDNFYGLVDPKYGFAEKPSFLQRRY